MGIADWPEGERPREKLLERGAAALSDAELLTADTLLTFDSCCTSEFLKQGK